MSLQWYGQYVAGSGLDVKGLSKGCSKQSMLACFAEFIHRGQLHAVSFVLVQVIHYSDDVKTRKKWHEGQAGYITILTLITHRLEICTLTLFTHFQQAVD